MKMILANTYAHVMKGNVMLKERQK